MAELKYNMLFLRVKSPGNQNISVFVALKSTEIFHHVEPPGFYRSLEWTNQTPERRG